MEKQCFACKQTKPAGEFYTSPQTKDGLMTYCKECHKAKINAGRAMRIANTVPVLPAPGSTKICRHCGVDKPIEQFGRNRTTSDGLQYACKPCSVTMVTASRRKDPTAHRRSSKAWREANPERNADNHVRRSYGLDHGSYARMLAAQGGKCAICGSTSPGARTSRFHVDHCHDTDIVRGLLCGACNTGIGQFKHDVVRILAAAMYLETPPAPVYLTKAEDV